MKKIMITLLLTALLICTFTFVIFADDEQLELDDLSFNIKPEKIEKETMIPIDRLSDELDINIMRLASGRFFIHQDNRHYIFKLGEREIKIRNATRMLSKAPLEINGHILVPLEFITDFLGYRVFEDRGGLKAPSRKEVDKIDVSLISEKKVVKDGRLKVYFLLENRGDDEEELSFRSGQKFDILLREKSGRIVYRWSEDKRFTQAFSEIEIEEGETVSMQAELMLYNLRDGEYYLEGYIDSEQGELWAERQLILLSD